MRPHVIFVCFVCSFQKNYASQLKEMLERRSEELRGVRGLLAAANKRLEELEARLRPQRQQEVRHSTGVL